MTCLAVALVAALASPAAPAAAPDTLATPPRVVRRFPEVVVHGWRDDPLATHVARTLDRTALDRLPVDRLAEAVALQAGVVARGDALYVRGGRAGEAPFTVDGMPLAEPFRGRALEVPMTALRSVELQTGALEARHPGALAGVIAAGLASAPTTPSVQARWQSSLQSSWRSDRVSGRAGAPLGRGGLGAVADVDVTLADDPWPDPRTETRHRLLGTSLGRRANDRLLGHARLGTSGERSPVALDVLAGRTLVRPYDPAWTLDGWTLAGQNSEATHEIGPLFSDTPRPGFQRYRAADHLDVTDTRHLAVLLSGARDLGTTRLGAALGWLRTREITSLDGRDDESYLTADREPAFGLADQRSNDPFHVYAGDDPYFRRRLGDVTWGQLEWGRALAHGRASAGLGGTWRRLALREVDVSTRGQTLDSVRTFTATSPLVFAWTQERWVFEGFVLNAGARLERFDAGAGAAAPGRTNAPHWSLSPRIGVAYPVSVRDVFSFTYARMQQDPALDFLHDDRTRPPDGRPLGDPELVPATVITYEAALRHLFDRGWSAQASTFFRDLYDLVGVVSTLGPDPLSTLRFANVDEAQVSGVECVLRREGRVLSGSLAYTWMMARGTLSREEGVPFGPLLGSRTAVFGTHALDWDRRHSLALSLAWTPSERLSLAWTTEAGSGLPWTPRATRSPDADLSQENTRRFRPDESSALAVRWAPPVVGRRLSVGLDVRNVFDHRVPVAATVDGYPNPVINTLYDDYGAYRTETGRDGGAYWNDRDGNGLPGWVPVNDPRLMNAPRSVRLSLGTGW